MESPSHPSSRIWPIEGEMALVEVFPNGLALIDAKNIEKVSEGRRFQFLNFYPRSDELGLYLHQIIAGASTKKQPIDHIDRNRLNNLESNLRHVTVPQNLFNSGDWKHNTSGVKGVSWDRTLQKWRAYIQQDHTFVYLGHFDNIADASSARRDAEKKAMIMEPVPRVRHTHNKGGPKPKDGKQNPMKVKA